MSRLDQHVGSVRIKLTLATFVRALAWAGTVFAGLALLAILVQRCTRFQLARADIWFWVGFGTTVAAALGYAIARRPTHRQAAVAIDQRLGLKEKFSTALYVRASKDPFAAAAVLDAENAAGGVNLRNQFPIPIPQRGTISLALLIVAALCSLLLEKRDRFASAEAPPARTVPPQAEAPVNPKAELDRALGEIDTAPRELVQDPQIKMATRDLTEARNRLTMEDTPSARQKAQDALQQFADRKKQIENANNYVKAVNEMNILKNVGSPSPSESGPIADAHRALADGKLQEAAAGLKKIADNFDKMDPAEQLQAAKQMQNLADQISKQTDETKGEKQIQKKLEQAGVAPQQAKDIAEKMKDAAKGDKQAQQQARDMTTKAIQQANQKPNQSAQQQQANANKIQQAAQQAQQQANGQAGAQQIAKTAQSLAKAMQGSCKGGQGKQSGSLQSPQTAMQQGGGKSGQQQMQQQAAQLQSLAKNAQAAAQQGQSGQQGPGQGQRPSQMPGSQGAGQQGSGQSPGQEASAQQQPGGQGSQNSGQGNPNQTPQSGGQGGSGSALGAANGRRPDPAGGDFKTKINPELFRSQTNENGQIIASSFVNAGTDRGESHAKLSQVIEAQRKTEGGEVDTDRIPRGAQKAVKDYFDTLKQNPSK